MPLRSLFLLILSVVSGPSVPVCVVELGGRLPYQQNLPRADENYDTSVKNPAYSKKKPTVLFDEAHQNLHRSDGLFKPFADLIRRDGYEVIPNSRSFEAGLLNDHDILVISNARARAPNQSAFTEAECDAVREWVWNGGALLLIADHTPLGGFADNLSRRFGVEMSNSYTDDPQNLDEELDQMVFSRGNGLLASHPITSGRDKSEKVSRIVSFTGQSLSVPPRSHAILQLSKTAIDEFPNTNRAPASAKGRAQMVALRVGKGRVVISGEAAMLTAQIRPDGFKFGLNASDKIDNRQLVLNLMHWLSGLLK